MGKGCLKKIVKLEKWWDEYFNMKGEILSRFLHEKSGAANFCRYPTLHKWGLDKFLEGKVEWSGVSGLPNDLLPKNHDQNI